MRAAEPAIADRSHLPELSVAFLIALRVSTCDCWSKFTIRRYQKTRMLLMRADQLRSVIPASASALSADVFLPAAASRGSALSQAPLCSSQISTHAWASELRMV